MTIARFKCTHCGRTDQNARLYGCGEKKPRFTEEPYSCDGWTVMTRKVRVTACPMDFRFIWDRLRYRLFGVLPR